MMHLKFPRIRGFFHWDELGCLSRALGFHENLFINHLPEELVTDRKGISLQELLTEVLDLHKYINSALDKSFNIHTDEWNISAIKKAAQLLDSHVFTFEEIEQMRVAYQMYESSDTRGLRLEEMVLQRAIKLCDRMISPLKMMQRIKHMLVNFEEKDRIQLHEFLDLLLWCELYQGTEVQPKDMNIKKDKRDQFELENFEQLLSHYDERLSKSLNHQYVQEELRYAKEKHGSKKMPKDVPPVDQEVRRKQVAHHKGRYQNLQNEVGESGNRVGSARAGYVRPRPISAPDLHSYHNVHDSSISAAARLQRPLSVQDQYGWLFRPATAASCSVKDIPQNYPRTALPLYQRPHTPATVTNGDQADCAIKMGTLHFEMETLNMRHQQILEEDLDFMVPGYREMKRNKPKPMPPPPPPPARPKPRPSQDTLQRLARPARPGLPRHYHAKTCDARFRGWNKAQTRRGSHYILTSQSYDSSPTSRLHNKLDEKSLLEINRKPILHRYTGHNQVQKSKSRPVYSSCSVRSCPSSVNSDLSETEMEEMDQRIAATLEKEKLSEESDSTNSDSDVDLQVYVDDDDDDDDDDDGNGEGHAASLPASQAVRASSVPPRRGSVKQQQLYQIPEVVETLDADDTYGSDLSLSKHLAQSDSNDSLHYRSTQEPNFNSSGLTKLTLKDEQTPSKTQQHQKDDLTVQGSAYVSPWFSQNPHATQYDFIKDIMANDHTPCVSSFMSKERRILHQVMCWERELVPLRLNAST